MGRMNMLSQPRPSFKAQMHQAREEAIVEATSRLLGIKGFETMTVDEVAATVGIAKASLYKHFAGKDDLCAAAMVHGVGRLQRGGEGIGAPQAVHHGRDGREQVDDVAQAAGESPRRVMRNEQRDPDGDRDGEHQCPEGRVDRAEGEGGHPGPEGAVATALQHLGGRGECREGLRDEEQGDGGQDDEDRNASAGGQAGEDLVADARLGGDEGEIVLGSLPGVGCGTHASFFTGPGEGRGSA